jgi:putative ABC transport system ATP-binding protein
MAGKSFDRGQVREELYAILSPEAGFYKVVVIYTIAISLLTLAVPISLQMLVDTIANIALLRAVVLIGCLLFGLLFISGVMYALRTYALELFSRKLYSRLSSEIAMTAAAASPDYFAQEQRSDLVNRYFDIIALKKSIPHILTNGFTLVLQSIIGFVVVSFYHLYFLIFSLSLIFLLWLVWKIWGWRAIETAIHLSEAKYQTGAWLQSLAVTSSGYHSSHRPDYGLQKTDALVDTHIEAQAEHFKNTFAQLLSMLFLQAAASAVLLGVGGWLVIQGQLTLGQLAAAELIMLAIFNGFPQMAGYLDSFYYVCAATEELARFRSVHTEEPDKESDVGIPEDHAIVFNKVVVHKDHQETLLSLEIPDSGTFRIEGNILCLRRMTDLLRRNYTPDSGLITIGGYDISEIRRQTLRTAVQVINRVTVPPLSVRDYLDLYNRPGARYSRQQALAFVNLDEDLSLYERGMETILSRGGSPLTQPQVIKLKLASAILSEPTILILEEIVDSVESNTMNEFLGVAKELGITVFYYTHRADLRGFDRLMKLEARQQLVEVLEAGASQ